MCLTAIRTKSTIDVQFSFSSGKAAQIARSWWFTGIWFIGSSDNWPPVGCKQTAASCFCCMHRYLALKLLCALLTDALEHTGLLNFERRVSACVMLHLCFKLTDFLNYIFTIHYIT